MATPTLDHIRDPVAYNFTSSTHHDTYDYINLSNFDLSGKYFLVSGASKVIGKQMVISLSQAGASAIALLARSSVSETFKEAVAAAKAAATHHRGCWN